MNRWSLGFFFALVAIPFIAVWSLTQSASVLDMLSPIYEISSVGRVVKADSTLIISDLVIEKRHSCHQSGAIYLAVPYSDDSASRELLIPLENFDGATLVKPLEQERDVIAIPQVRASVARDVLKDLSRVRLMISCVRPLVGLTHAYTNSIVLR